MKYDSANKLAVALMGYPGDVKNIAEIEDYVASILGYGRKHNTIPLPQFNGTEYQRADELIKYKSPNTAVIEFDAFFGMAAIHATNHGAVISVGGVEFGPLFSELRQIRKQHKREYIDALTESESSRERANRLQSLAKIVVNMLPKFIEQSISKIELMFIDYCISAGFALNNNGISVIAISGDQWLVHLDSFASKTSTVEKVSKAITGDTAPVCEVYPVSYFVSNGQSFVASCGHVFGNSALSGVYSAPSISHKKVVDMNQTIMNRMVERQISLI